MFKMINKTLKNKKGFTLVELMVVVTIIGILTSIAVPVYNSVTDSAEQSAVEANLRTLDGAVMMFYAENESWPSSITDLDAFIKGACSELGPDGASYNLTGAGTSNASAIVSSTSGNTVGGTTLSNVTLNNLPW